MTKKKNKIKKLKKKLKHQIEKIKESIKKLIIFLDNRIMIMLPLNKKKCLFISDDRENLGGNLEYMYNYIPDDKYTKVISLKDDRRTKRTITEEIKLVYNLSTSKYIFLEDLCEITSNIKFRKNQELIQLWHGAGAFKKFGASRCIENGGDLKSVHSGYKKYTRAITSSEKIRKCYAEAFSIGIEKVKATGVPRTDLFFNEDEMNKRKDKIYEKYPYLRSKKVILFAPTYRGINLSEASFDFNKIDLNKIYKELKDEYIFVFKWHPFIYNNMVRGTVKGYNLSGYDNFFYDLSKERDINDLLLIADILITDYSSVIFDYAFLNKPIIYFTYDLEKYEKGRGLYFPFEDYIYGKVAKTDGELIDAIKAEDLEEEKRKKFMDKFLSACDGNSTKKTYEWIFENKE